MRDPRVRDSRVAEYETLYGCRLIGYLGSGPGQDGYVLRTDQFHAVKFFDRPERFQRECEVYRVLSEKDIHDIVGHQVPTLVRVDERLLTIEMTIVAAPFLLDFAGAKHPWEVPDFDDDVIAEHYAHLQELFGDRWTDALHVSDAFQAATGFVYLDPHPGNIAFADASAS